MDELGDAIHELARKKTIICGDFNCRSSVWGSSNTNRKGTILAEWMAEQGMALANVGNRPTCVRPQGSSIVDLTWTSQDLAGRIHNWRVLDGENMSDHRYVFFHLREESTPSVQGRGPPLPRWNLKKFDAELFAAALDWIIESDPMEVNTVPANELQERLDRFMRDALDLAAPRVHTRNARRQVYWWNENIANLRRQSNSARRRFTRARSQGRFEEADRLRTEHKARRKDLKRAIRRAMLDALRELILSIDEDPWGLPYKMVLARLRRSSPGLTELLEGADLDVVLDSLFPNDDDRRTLASSAVAEHPATDALHMWEEELTVRPDEVYDAIKGRDNIKNTAPGLDGIKATVWKQVPNSMLDRVVQCFDTCLREGTFPEDWKRAKLVLNWSFPQGERRRSRGCWTAESPPDMPSERCG